MRDPEQDGVGDGAPDATGNGFARGAFEEAVARPDGAADTDDDQADFVKLRATPLAPNVFSPPVETVAPTVTGSSTGAAVPVSELLWVGFDEPIDPASATPTTVTMKIATSPVEVDALTFTDGDRTVVVNTVGRLPFDVDVEVTLHGGAGGVTDLAGNALAADHVFSVHTEAAPANPAPVRINELVVTPVQDWNDTAGGDGAPFSATPGTGQVTSSDEWVELVNASGATVDMSGYTLVVYDGFNVFTAARAATVLGESSSVVVYGASSGVDAVAPDDCVVVGNPAGSLFFDCYVELRDGGGALVDAVEIGGNFASQDRGGDGVDNGAPEAGADGRSTGVADEAIARVPDGADTGDDVADFVAASATLGAAND